VYLRTRCTAALCQVQETVYLIKQVVCTLVSSNTHVYQIHYTCFMIRTQANQDEGSANSNFTNWTPENPRPSPFQTHTLTLSTHKQCMPLTTPKTVLVPHKVKFSRCKLVRQFWNRLIIRHFPTRGKRVQGHKDRNIKQTG